VATPGRTTARKPSARSRSLRGISSLRSDSAHAATPLRRDRPSPFQSARESFVRPAGATVPLGRRHRPADWPTARIDGKVHPWRVLADRRQRLRERRSVGTARGTTAPERSEGAGVGWGGPRRGAVPVPGIFARAASEASGKNRSLGGLEGRDRVDEARRHKHAERSEARAARRASRAGRGLRRQLQTSHRHARSVSHFRRAGSDSRSRLRTSSHTTYP
jgi:hypothetical protein